MCLPCLQNLGECTHFNNSQEESNIKGKGPGQRTQSGPCRGPRYAGRTEELRAGSAT